MADGEIRVDLADLPIGGMVQGERGDEKVLFVRDASGVRAFQAKCPHYGAPLAKGLICGSTLYCPWHKAAFDIGDGSLLEPPALDALTRYPVRIDGDSAVATLVPMRASEPPPRSSDRTIVVVGTGAAAVAAVKTLRSEGFGGTIVMVGQEGDPPYDRPKLSKNFLAKQTDRSAMVLERDFYGASATEYVAGPAVEIDVTTRTVRLNNGQTIVADDLLIATGSRAATLDCPGAERGSVFTLRSLADAVAISEACDGAARVAIVGGGFIALEAAAFLTKRGLAATIVAPEPLPLAARFGDAVAGALKSYHESCGITFVQGNVVAIEGNGALEAVRLENGTTIEADLVLVGIGAKPRTDMIKGVSLREDGGIAVDTHLRVAPHVWAAGDIAAFPESHSGTTARIEHWRLAEQHGVHVAHAMMGEEEAFVAAPFFWTNQGDKRLDYAGYAPDYDRTITRGDVAGLDFITFYVREGRALAACAIGQGAQLIGFLHLLDAGRVPAAADLEKADLATLAR